jgi:hypothetical protein
MGRNRLGVGRVVYFCPRDRKMLDQVNRHVNVLSRFICGLRIDTEVYLSETWMPAPTSASTIDVTV